MDKEFLEDYEEKERQEIEQFIKSALEEKFLITQRFPPETRFGKLHAPVVYRGTPRVDIWPLVPFSGSTIIPLLPAEKETFERLHRFEVDEIDEIVSFAEETGKIQFVLMEKPTKYSKLDFLDPIFERLTPPQFSGMPLKIFASYDSLNKFSIEFSTLANLGFADYVRETNPYRVERNLLEKFMNNLRGNYMMIKTLASSDICQDLENSLVSDHKRAMDLFHVTDILILRPVRNPLRCIESYTLEDLRKARQFAKSRGIKMHKKPFPCEIGKLLMKKLTYYPESLEACKELVAHYDEQDVCRLFNEINKGVIRDQPDMVERSQAELSIVLDNIWTDKSLQRKIAGIRFGVPLLIGAVGTIAAGISGAFVGLLSGIGFNVIDKLFELKKEAFSEKVSKSLCLSYQSIIFDFKKKYSLADK